MTVKYYKPTSAGRRKSSVDLFNDITETKPYKPLLAIRKKKSGRNAQGKITVRHQGGGTRKYLRLIDFKMDKFDVSGKVVTIEYDPNRNARIALVSYLDGDKRYIIAPVGLKVGDKIVTSKKTAEINLGNRLPLHKIPEGMMVYNIELFPGKGAELVRSAGTGAQIMATEGQYCQLKLPSGEIRLVSKDCMATIGQVSNPEYMQIRWGKAGRTRYLGVRPTVRGKAMNPVDHPHGGGEGRNSIGLKAPKTPWGKKALGVKTRDKKKASNKFILSRRVHKAKKK